VNVVGPTVPTIQEEVQDLDAGKVLNKRTISGKSVGTSQTQPPQPPLPKKKKKPAIRKLNIIEYVSKDEEKIEATTNLVTREIKNKKAAEEASLQKADLLAQEIGVPAEQLLKDSTVKAIQIGIELTENLQQLVVDGERLDTTEAVQEERAACSEADASRVNQGNTDPHHISNIVEIDSSTTLDSHSTSVSNSSTSSNIDVVPLNNLCKSTKILIPIIIIYQAQEKAQ
jgi:hypothetical protein